MTGMAALIDCILEGGDLNFCSPPSEDSFDQCRIILPSYCNVLELQEWK